MNTVMVTMFLQPGAADRLDGLVELAKKLSHLAFESEILLRRTDGLTAEPDGLTALGDHRARERTLFVLTRRAHSTPWRG